MRRKLIICLLLVATTAVVYGQVLGFEFVRYDDPAYVTENRTIQNGPTLHGLVWAFTTGHGGNWHPLTWLSHMLDCRLYGLNPAGHHLTNLLLHLGNTLLLFGLLQSITRAVWPSALVAALFALHPLHVESVAWVSERKDGLSTLFGLLSLWAYAAYARRGGIGPYLLTAVLLSMGLMAKPMLVTLPLVLLLLDYWPLDRLRAGRPSNLGLPTRRLAMLLIEKIPLLVLSAAFSVVAVIMQHRGHAMAPADQLGFQLRAANAVVSYVRYMAKMIWPVELSPLYPHPVHAGATAWQPWQILGAGMLLVLISVLVFLARRRRYLPVGWLWYLGTLVPVIGLIQVGMQAMADRYTYLPLIGLFIAIAWAGTEVANRLAHRHRPLRSAAVLAAVIMLVACATRSWSQTRYWHDSVSLFRHALDATPRNPIMLYNLANELTKLNRFDEAIDYYHRALEYKLQLGEIHNNLGRAYGLYGKIDRSVHHYRESIRYRPKSFRTHYNLGNALKDLGQYDQAIHHYRQAQQHNPESIEVLTDLAAMLAITGQLEQSYKCFESLALLDPKDATSQYNLGISFSSRGRFKEAVKHLRRALEIRPDYADAHHHLGAALDKTGRPEEALAHLRQAARHIPGWPLPLNHMAWILATHPDAAVRDAATAIDHAKEASRLTDNRNPPILDTLAAAYAAAGQFDDAVRTAQTALELAMAAGAKPLAEEIRGRLEAYRQSKPWRQPQGSQDQPQP